MMLVAGAVYSLVCPLDSYAAEAQPWVRDALHSIGPAISPPWGIIAIGFVICSALAAFIVGFLCLREWQLVRLHHG